MISRIIRQSGGIWNWFRNNSIIITFLLGQVVVFGGWMLAQELTDRQNIIDINYAKDSITAIRADIAAIDQRGSRELPEVRSRLSQHEGQLATDRKHIDELIEKGSPTLRAEVKAAKEQQDRNIRAIEILRQDLNDHIRWDANNKIPLPPRRSAQ